MKENHHPPPSSFTSSSSNSSSPDSSLNSLAANLSLFLAFFFFLSASTIAASASAAACILAAARCARPRRPLPPNHYTITIIVFTNTAILYTILILGVTFDMGSFIPGTLEEWWLGESIGELCSGMAEGSGAGASTEGLHGRSRACIEVKPRILVSKQKGNKRAGVFSKATRMITTILNNKKLQKR
ncbi:UNVERIFIED_CONTAM: hypothetical protein Sangu_1990200 [Sesamum angustifolium]|uniref:Uncharacterized protein n=1 Tax=Sesamum angustifolium TaxID=2727405 RepID=A0AAW2LIS1_9LAMI